MNLADTLSWLVDIPSVTGQEGLLCQAITERLKPSTDEVVRVGNSLVAGRRTSRPLILLVGHLDTVPFQGQGSARIEDGRLYGLGASDMKSGLAVILHLLESVQVREGPFDVVGIFYEAEEGAFKDNGLEPVLQTLEWLAQASLAIVAEPTDLALQLGCTGVVNAAVSFYGKAAHSARPWLGTNAVTKAGAWLSRLHGLSPEPYKVGGLTFYEVFSVTWAKGGVANNVIPAEFELNLNYRFSPHRSPDEAEARLLEVVSEGADSVEVKESVLAAPVPARDPLLDRLLQCVDAPVEPKQAWTDVARLATYGIPAVNYGPGETTQAHQAGEGVALVNLETAYQSLHRFLTDPYPG